MFTSMLYYVLRATSITAYVFPQWWQSTDLQLSAWTAGIVGGEGGHGAHWCQCQLFTAYLSWPHVAGQPTTWHSGCQPGNLYYKINKNYNMPLTLFCFFTSLFLCMFIYALWFVSVISVKNVCSYSIVVLQIYVTHIVEIYCLIYYSFWVI